MELDHFTSWKALEKRGFSLARNAILLIKVMIENVLRREDGVIVTTGQIEALAKWNGKDGEREVSFMPARVLLQDFTGVPVVADLAAMRDAIKRLGGDPAKANPLQPVDLVIDHSVQVDSFGSADSFAANAKLEFERNRERYLFLRWGQGAFDDFRVVPPDTGIVHQVNLEYLAPVVFLAKDGEAYPDTVIGTDSHTTMINGLGVVGWGVGGIEAEAAMLGRSMPMLIPEVIGFRLAGSLRPGATATDLVLTVTQMLRRKGVVGKFVEYFGPGAGLAAGRGPRDARQHVARVWRDDGIFPGRRSDADLSAADRTQRRPGQADRGLLQGAGAVQFARRARAEIFRHARARSRQRRAEYGGAAPSAGSSRAYGGQGRLPARAGQGIRGASERRSRRADEVGCRRRQRRFFCRGRRDNTRIEARAYRAQG